MKNNPLRSAAAGAVLCLMGAMLIPALGADTHPALEINQREPKLQMAQKPLVCAACNQKNPTGYLFCFNCNQPLNEASKKKANANSILDLIVTDEELRQQFDALLEMAYKKQHPR